MSALKAKRGIGVKGSDASTSLQHKAADQDKAKRGIGVRGSYHEGLC